MLSVGVPLPTLGGGTAASILTIQGVGDVLVVDCKGASPVLEGTLVLLSGYPQQNLEKPLLLMSGMELSIGQCRCLLLLVLVLLLCSSWS